MTGPGGPDGKTSSPGGTESLGGLLLVVLLAVAIALESYYIFVLRETIDTQTEELRNLSIQLQSSKSNGTELRERLSSMQKLAGEKDNGNTTDGQH